MEYDILKDVKDPNELLFISFVSLLYNSGIQQLGKIMNPVTGKIHKDIAGASSTIELLKMIKVKTGGNLSDREKGMLDSSISNLQMNYVEELELEKKKTSEAPQAEDSGAQESKEK